MAHYSIFVTIIVTVLSTSCVQCTEFVPVYMWGTEKTSEHVPALHKISQDSFKDTVLEFLKKEPFIIVFAERTLSPEDFAQHDHKGHSSFKNIQELKNEGNYISYRPYVQNPIYAIKQVDRPITQTSIKSILTNENIPEDNIWIIDLDDAKDDETRFHMLKRHDSDIVSIYQDILREHTNVLAIYTANHTAWIAPEEVSHNRRNLLDETEPEETAIYFNNEFLMLYFKDSAKYDKRDVHINITQKFTLSITPENPTTHFNATMASPAPDNLKLTFQFSSSADYWYMNNISDGSEVVMVNDIYAPFRLSYHCTNITFKSTDFSLFLPGLQIQAFGHGNSSEFGDAYDCVGFTSVPIWSGLFVTAILLFIITFGLTMMVDIKTMDRFDDPKGKTITITATD